MLTHDQELEDGTGFLGDLHMRIDLIDGGETVLVVWRGFTVNYIGFLGQRLSS